MPADRHGHQHRSLSADRGTVADHPLDLVELLVETPSPVHHHDQVGPRAPRPRSAQASRRPKGFASVAISVTFARSQGRAHARTARAAAEEAPGRGQGAQRSRRPLLCRHRAGPSRKSPTMSSNISSKRRSKRARRAASICRSACRTKSRPCSAPGSTNIIPDRAAKVMATIRAIRGGKDNDPDFFSRMRGSGGRGRTSSAPGSKSPQRNMGSGKPNSGSAVTCSSPPQGDQMRLLLNKT